MTTSTATVRSRSALRRLPAFLTTLLLALALSLQGGLFQASAKTQSELEKDKAALQQEAQRLRNEYKEASKDLKGQQKVLDIQEKQVENARKQLNIINDQIDSLNHKLSGKNSEIGRKEAQIKEKETSAKVLSAQLDEQLRAVAKKGNLSSMQMLLSTKDYAEYLIKSKMLEKIAEQNQNGMDALEAELRQIKTDKVSLETDKQSIAKEKAQVVSLQKEANAKKKEMDAFYKNIQSKVNSLKNDVESIKKKQRENDAEIEKTNKYIQNIINASKPTGKYGDGSMVWPVPTVRSISSKFGYRWGKLHGGIDIADGPIPVYGEKIVAAADGVVIYSNYTSTSGGGYGYHCIVDHGIDSKGKRILTLYAHASKMYARVGNKVKAGKTVLALAGDTGNVTGPHLHFEVRENDKRVDPIKKGYVSANR